MKMIKKAKKGFTLIELVVVIAVIAILTGVSVVAYVGITNNAKESAAMQEARAAYNSFYADELLKENPNTELTLDIKNGDYWFHVTEGKFDTKGTKDAAGDRATIPNYEIDGETLKAVVPVE